MGTNSDFKESLKTTLDIILNLNLTLGDIKYYNEAKSKKQNVILNEYRFLWRAHYAIYITMVLYYNKLFIGDEDPSLIKLLNQSINNYKGLDWKKKPDIVQLQDYLKVLKECESSVLIQNLKTARDTYYAHFDKKRPPKILIETEDLDNYLNIAQTIINYIHDHYEGRKYHFAFSDVDKGHYIFDNLFKHRQIRMAMIDLKININSAINIDNIREIMDEK